MRKKGRKMLKKGKKVVYNRKTRRESQKSEKRDSEKCVKQRERFNKK